MSHNCRLCKAAAAAIRASGSLDECGRVQPGLRTFRRSVWAGENLIRLLVRRADNALSRPEDTVRALPDNKTIKITGTSIRSNIFCVFQVSLL